MALRSALKVTDSERHDQLLAMIESKCLTYRRIGEADQKARKLMRMRKAR